MTRRHSGLTVWPTEELTDEELMLRQKEVEAEIEKREQNRGFQLLKRQELILKHVKALIELCTCPNNLEALKQIHNNGYVDGTLDVEIRLYEHPELAGYIYE